jgi:undecaprenyl diphosphate synthase
MVLLKKYLLEAIGKMERDRVKMKFFGDLSPLDEELRRLCLRTEEISKRYDGCQVNICLNYGGRDELVRAARAFARDCVAGKADPARLTESGFADYLYSAGVPDPDLVIRPSGELRLSNFLPWQSAYAEFYFTEALWPDFGKKELLQAIAAFQHRSRRYGGV